MGTREVSWFLSLEKLFYLLADRKDQGDVKNNDSGKGKIC